jgi:hypothetical protein
MNDGVNWFLADHESELLVGLYIGKVRFKKLKT